MKIYPLLVEICCVVFGEAMPIRDFRLRSKIWDQGLTVVRER